MESLIKQAFVHIPVVEALVGKGHYDLVGPNGDIILPQVWDGVIEPGWTITIHMWPIPEFSDKSESPTQTDSVETVGNMKVEKSQCLRGSSLNQAAKEKAIDRLCTKPSIRGG